MWAYAFAGTMSVKNSTICCRIPSFSTCCLKLIVYITSSIKSKNTELTICSLPFTSTILFFVTLPSVSFTSPFLDEGLPGRQSAHKVLVFHWRDSAGFCGAFFTNCWNTFLAGNCGHTIYHCRQGNNVASQSVAIQYHKELGPWTAKLALLLIKIIRHGIVQFLLHK